MKEVISRAAVRRLARDGGGRLTKLKHDDVVGEVEKLLARLLGASARAMAFSGRRSIDDEHVRYAFGAVGVPVSEELAQIKEEDLKMLRRCNVRAPADVRKTATSVEISEASFARLAKAVANECKPGLRLTVSARHLLQLVAEERVVGLFRPEGSPVATKSVFDVGASRAFAATFGQAPSPSTGLEMSRVAVAISDHIPALLDVAAKSTVDARLVLAAAASVAPEAAQAAAEETAPQPTPLLVKYCDRFLRGRATDRRVTRSASKTLAQILTCVVALAV